MPPENLRFNRRAQPAELPELMDGPITRGEMRACLRDLARVNTWLGGYRPTFRWLHSIARRGRPLTILDVGCADGDGLRRIARWAKKNRIQARLIGLDLSADAISIARETTPQNLPIEFIHADVFAFNPAPPVDLIHSSLFTHHLSDSELIRFIAWMESNATLGWFINDLSRAETPYRLFTLLARATRLHTIVQHDGPVSIRRAFRPEDWQNFCSKAGLAASDYAILSYIPARLCIARRKPA